MDIKKELRDVCLILGWLIIGILIGFACGYVHGSVETLKMASEVVANVLL